MMIPQVQRVGGLEGVTGVLTSNTLALTTVLYDGEMFDE